MILLLFILSLVAVLTSGYQDPSCRPPSRSARAREPPCDLRRQGWCGVAGAAYPWHAVRRFIRENQGLMRRMYGEERQAELLRAELMNEDVHYRYSDPEKLKYKPGKHRFASESPRLLNHEDAILNTKFIYSEEPNLKTNELYTLPHFRQTSTTEMNTFIENNTLVEPMNRSSTPEEANSVYTNFTVTFAREEQNQTLDETDVANSTEETTTTDETTTVPTTVEMSTTSEKTEGSTTQNVNSGQLFQDDEKDEKVVYSKRRGVNACPVKEEVVAPFWANNTRGEVLALLNFYPFEQYVHWEKCTFEHRQMYCREGCRCEQQYRLHRLLAYDPNNECRGIFSDWFKFPSCCVCKCYDMPMEFRVTSRSPRQKDGPQQPEWYRRKVRGV